MIDWECHTSMLIESGRSPVTSNKLTNVSSPTVQKTLLEGWQLIALICQEWAKNSAMRSPSNVARRKSPFAKLEMRMLIPLFKQLSEVTGTSASGLKVDTAVIVDLSSI